MVIKIILDTSSHFEHEPKFLPNIVLQNSFIQEEKKRNSKVNHVISRGALFSTGPGASVPENFIDWIMSDVTALRPQLF